MVTSVRPGVAEPQPPAQTWSDRWREARNRLLASARFAALPRIEGALPAFTRLDP